jgi:hypothetical protein
MPGGSSAQRRDVDLKRVFLHHQAGPDGFEELRLANNFIGPRQQQGEDLEGWAERSTGPWGPRTCRSLRFSR